MTLARKIYKMMEIGKDYRMSDIVDMLYSAEREYMDSDPDIDEALNEEWLEAVQGSDIRQKIRDALKITRKFGYTTVNVTVIEPHDVEVSYRAKGKYGIGFTGRKTLHYGEFKDYTYRRIK